MFSNKIEVIKDFQTSINIAYDIHNDEKIRNFIPTMASIEIIEDVLLSTMYNANQRARILIGAYGRGKSHIILVLMALLFKKDEKLFSRLLKKIEQYNKELYNYALNYIRSDRKLLPVIISGSNLSLTQSFLNALQQTLISHGLEDLLPDTNFRAAINTIHLWKSDYPDTYGRFVKELNKPVNDFILLLKEYDVAAYNFFVSLYPKLTSGSKFNPFTGMGVVEIYENVAEKLVQKGYDGIFVIYDEFSKYLESSIEYATINDIKMLQDFAEKCDRSGSNQMHLMLICHKDIENYIDEKLPKEKIDGWRSVSGRFKHINLHNNYHQMYEIISAVIKKDEKFMEENKNKFIDLIQKYATNGMLDVTNRNILEVIVEGCYPLHPITTFILPRLSERIAQNERTLFTFLSSEQKYTLTEFLKATDEKFPMVTPDYLFDYFESQLRKEPYNSEIYKLYRLTSNILRKLEKESLDAKIIKTIALIYIIEEFDKLPPIIDVIVDAFQYSAKDTTEISSSINKLIEKDCIIYLKRSNSYLKLKESSGIDIPSEIHKTVDKIKNTIRVKEILNSSSFYNYIYPTRYNDEKEMIRFFSLLFMDSNEFWSVNNWDKKIENVHADGVVYAIIPSSNEDLEKIRESFKKENQKHNRIVFIIPKLFKEIDNIVYEYCAVQELKTLAVDDELLTEEYDIYIEDLEEVIFDFIFGYIRPETGCSEYYYMGQKIKLYRKSQLSELLSKICEEIYPNTPIINNESINKNVLSTNAINSRTKLVSKLLEEKLDRNLGLKGTGQDVFFLRSTLIQTGILKNVDCTPVINLKPDDEKMANMLLLIENFFMEATNGKCFRELYDTLTHPNGGIGLKKGVIPIYIAVVLHGLKKNIIIKRNENEESITAELLNNINDNPDEYYVYLENWNRDKIKYLQELANIFGEYIIEKERVYNNFSYIVFAMNRWYMSLPKYAKEMNTVYRGLDKPKYEPVKKEYKRFLNSLKQIDNNHRDYLFNKIFACFGISNFNLDIINEVSKAKKTFDEAKENLIKVLIEDAKKIFGIELKNEKASLTSTIKDWYEALNDDTINYLFKNNENKILEAFRTITNDEIAFIERLGRIITSLRIDDWSDTTVDLFISELIAFKNTIEDFNKNSETIKNNSELYKIVFVQKDGTEIIRTFNKSTYSERAKLLMNEITTCLEEMGEAITIQEKRQVLIELLEKMS